MPRPFYGEFAWAYALLVKAPIAARCAFIAECFAQAGVAPGAHVLDAGCGPGHYAIELARRGYTVTGIDASPEFIAQAAALAATSGSAASFVGGDILALPAMLGTAGHAARPADAILCRGVLNDLIEDAQRRDVFGSFAAVLRADGALLFDVRDWQATVARKARQPVSEQTVATPRGALTFRSVTRLDEVRQRLLIEERHTLRGPEGMQDITNAFTMRCWTMDELLRALRLAGLAPLHFYGDYDAAVPIGATDRMVCLARRD